VILQSLSQPQASEEPDTELRVRGGRLLQDRAE
jgi:hypothetical protein